MSKRLAALGLCLIASCVLPDVPIVDSLAGSAGGGAGAGGSGGSSGSNASECPSTMPAIIDNCMGVAPGTVCYWFPVACTCQASLIWTCTGCEQGAPCATAGQTCPGSDGQCECQAQKWQCPGSGSGGAGSGGSGGSTAGSAGSTTGGSAGASGSAGAAGSGGTAGSGTGGAPATCNQYCGGPDGILVRCPMHVQDWPDETICVAACQGHPDSDCWIEHLGFILDGGGSAHCPHATGSPDNGICGER